METDQKRLRDELGPRPRSRVDLFVGAAGMAAVGAMVVILLKGTPPGSAIPAPVVQQKPVATTPAPAAVPPPTETAITPPAETAAADPAPQPMRHARTRTAKPSKGAPAAASATPAPNGAPAAPTPKPAKPPKPEEPLPEFPVPKGGI